MPRALAFDLREAEESKFDFEAVNVPNSPAKMSVTSKPDRFFQTSSSLDEINRKANKSYNTDGDPIKLPSKLLAVVPDPVNEDGIYVAESAGTVKRVSLSTREVTLTFVGPNAPISCVHVHAQSSPDGVLEQTLYAGSWDKSIWEWKIPCTPTSTASIKSGRQYRGHTDFVKALETLSLPGTSAPLLISGGAESEILFWDTKSGTRLHVLKGHIRGVLALQFDPTTTYPGTDSAVLYTASSSREIRTCQIPIPVMGHAPVKPSDLSLKSLQLSAPLVVHDTSVYDLHFDSDGGLWTASADKTAKHMTRKDSDATDSSAVGAQPTTMHTRSESSDLKSDWEIDTTLPHPDFVRAIATHPTLTWVVTACRDEEVRVWNAATGHLEHTYTGHYEEVTGLTIRGGMVVSVSIDGTIRRWRLGKDDIIKAKQEAEEKKQCTRSKEDSNENAGVTKVELTEEEERELAELMAEE